MTECYVEDCNNEILPFSFEGDEDGVCTTHLNKEDIESLGHCPNCKSQKVYKYATIQEITNYTKAYKLTDYGSFDECESDDDDTDSSSETSSEEIRCDDCDFEKSWDYS